MVSKKGQLNGLDDKKLQDIYRVMYTIRAFEERIRTLFLEGKMPGTIHQYIGMEACAAGVVVALNHDDVIASTHRPHGHAIAKGIPVKELMAELYGKTTGCCKGKGGSMHVGDIQKGMLPAIAIVGGNIPIAAGMGLAFKLKGQQRVAVSFFGDGATNEGAFHEALNMASIYNLPVVFVCENNLYGASTDIRKMTKIKDIADRACSYGMDKEIADGMDVLDVYKKAEKAVQQARKYKGPTLLELKTFRFCGHSRRDPSNYIPEEEKESWAKKDPIERFKKLLLSEEIADEDQIKEIEDEVLDNIEQAIDYAQDSPDPEASDTLKDLYVTMEVPE